MNDWLEETREKKAFPVFRHSPAVSPLKKRLPCRSRGSLAGQPHNLTKKEQHTRKNNTQLV